MLSFRTFLIAESFSTVLPWRWRTKTDDEWLAQFTSTASDKKRAVTYEVSFMERPLSLGYPGSQSNIRQVLQVDPHEREEKGWWSVYFRPTNRAMDTLTRLQRQGAMRIPPDTSYVARPYQVLGVGRPMEKFATVFAIMKAFILAKKPAGLRFTAEEDNRRSLYTRLLPLIPRELPEWVGVIPRNHYDEPFFLIVPKDRLNTNPPDTSEFADETEDDGAEEY